jgi:hypothetical protein
MSKDKNNSSAIERLANLKKEQDAAKASAPKEDLVNQLAHENDGKPDFSDLAQKLQERQEREAKGENEDHVKLTIYVEKNLAAAFNALITKRGQQKEFINIALSDFVQKKAKELGIDK